MQPLLRTTLDLTEYKLTKETDRLKVYEVYFVLYGDNVSGWDVRI